MVLNSVGSRLRVVSKVRLTSANPLALRVFDPLKTRLSRFSELRWDIFCSPITHRILYTLLLLPHPLGPTMPVMFSSKFTSVLSAKLLKPLISRDFNRTIAYFITDKDNATTKKSRAIDGSAVLVYSQFLHRYSLRSYCLTPSPK